MKKITIISLFILLVDQIIKYIVINNMSLYKSIEIIPNFFNITYVENIGAAFSILSGNVLFLILISLFAIILIYLFLIKNKKLNKLQITMYSLLIGGIIGNLVDRIFRGFVVDYLDFSIFGYNFPIFNFADVCIVLSAIALLFINIKEEKNDTHSN